MAAPERKSVRSKRASTRTLTSRSTRDLVNLMSLSDDNDDFENVPAMNELQKNKQYKSKDRKNPIIIDSNPERCPGQNTIPVTNSFPSYCARKQSGQNVSTKYEKTLKLTVVQNVKKMAVYKVESPFDRRISSLVWHPKLITTLAAGSKGGDIILWNHKHETHDIFVKGSGPGGSIQAMKFDINEENHLYTCSIEGTVCRRDLKTKQVSVYLNTGVRSVDNWYTSLDVSFTSGLILAGDNKGHVNLLTKDGNIIWEKRLHENKVHHIEFHTGQPWLFVTSSLDNLVRLWDVRNIKDTKNVLAELRHEKGITSAYFSPAHGTRLLTTDQHNELKVFSGPLWNLETTILHPHRHFQHITQIKAHWHPLEDIIVVGRYPDPKFPGYKSTEPRSVDFFDPSDGELLYQLESVSQKGIMSLNRFDPVGNVLASAMGQHILLWKPKYSETAVNPINDDKRNSKPTKRRALKVYDGDDDLKKNSKSGKKRKGE